MNLVVNSCAVLALLTAGGCGYSFQNSNNPLGDKEGIRKVFVAPLINNTYKAGVENVVYNALLRSLSVHRRVTLVTNPEQADAVLKGTISLASYVSSSSNTVGTAPDQFKDVLVATEYTASLSCGFILERTHPGPRQRKVVWTASFSRTQPFGASNLIGVAGTTSGLINESEFDRTLSAMATSMTSDVHESMLAMF